MCVPPNTNLMRGSLLCVSYIPVPCVSHPTPTSCVLLSYVCPISLSNVCPTQHPPHACFSPMCALHPCPMCVPPNTHLMRASLLCVPNVPAPCVSLESSRPVCPIKRPHPPYAWFSLVCAQRPCPTCVPRDIMTRVPHQTPTPTLCVVLSCVCPTSLPNVCPPRHHDPCAPSNAHTHLMLGSLLCVPNVPAPRVSLETP